MTKIEQLQKFIKDNNLKFTEGRRNNDLTVLCGYGLYIISNLEELWTSIPTDVVTEELEKELDRVFKYTEANNYGQWWENEANRNQYKL